MAGNLIKAGDIPSEHVDQYMVMCVPNHPSHTINMIMSSRLIATARDLN